MLLPVTHVKEGGAHWNEWLGEWMALWGSVSHSAYWDTLWMGLISRLAKLDKNGKILLHPFLPSNAQDTENSPARRLFVGQYMRC